MPVCCSQQCLLPWSYLNCRMLSVTSILHMHALESELVHVCELALIMWFPAVAQCIMKPSMTSIDDKGEGDTQLAAGVKNLLREL